MKNWGYKPQNNTVNSVFDCESNKTTTKKTCSKGPKLCLAKGMALVIHCLHFSNKYVICWNMIRLDSKVINRYNVCLWLKLALGIRRYYFAESNGSIFIYVACTEPKIWTSKILLQFCKIAFPVKKYPADFTNIATGWNIEIKDEKLRLQASK
jgi:hypothetical protein